MTPKNYTAVRDILGESVAEHDQRTAALRAGRRDSMDTTRKMRAGADGVLRSDSGMTTQEVIDSALGEPGVAVTLSDLRELLTRADARGFPADPFLSLLVKKYPAVVEHHEARYVEFAQRPCTCNAAGCPGCEQCEGCTCKRE